MKVGALPDRHARLDSVWLDESTSLVHYTYNTQSQVATVTRQAVACTAVLPVMMASERPA
ncbi:hypothetical protein [Pectobacterium parmentieri]|uniref:Uncharacterized protein n=1 Tax=Pectobacterium parmentieri TaxID=1905730 RepID=A0A8B3FHI1_PECPM|nr:hypothetical protein [Pectobacterium parmentieri]AOR60684.1 hypothetical protein A8F97_17585 [Pectobacterium parmentieri]AYH08381.1 hypothetical protein C5E24_00815 [Pectobacterium parmentieri]AYH17124.1 hypothetical protein C5E22_00815 [Pectobacterium parmentieri]AYH34738.1 hypothetical protein C5E17_00885 [Pectobacterium parmentieri]AZS54813.1 hypothetical protein C5E18_00815 [Pectobacterium parmentieri]